MFDYSMIAIVIVVLAAAASGAIFKPGEWYERLDKPGFTPPNWVFPVVWSILYVMIGIAGWLAWKSAGAAAPIVIWSIQIILNASWSAVFFGIYRMDLAFGVVVLLGLSVMAFIVAVWPYSQTAALLFVPYLIWVILAAALNLRVWQMNPDASAAASR